MIHALMRFWNMLENTFPILSRTAVKQFLRFGIVGVSNTALDFGVYLALTRPFAFWEAHKVAATVIAFSMAATWSYVWNKYWTFADRSRVTAEQFASFFLVSIGGLLINAGTLWLAIQVLFIYDLFGKAAAVVLTLIWNFFVNKYWTFRSGRAR